MCKKFPSYWRELQKKKKKRKRTLIYTIALTYNFDSAVLALQADEKSQYIH